MRLREGEGGHKVKSNGKPELILCREDGRVVLFLTVDNGHMKTCGTPGVDWRYMSPKSVLIDCESGRGRKAGAIIEMAQCLAKMTGFRLRDEMVSCDIGRRRNA